MCNGIKRHKILRNKFDKIYARSLFRKKIDIVREMLKDLNNGNIYYVHELEAQCSLFLLN